MIGFSGGMLFFLQDGVNTGLNMFFNGDLWRFLNRSTLITGVRPKLRLFKGV